MKLCECGCGDPAPIATTTDTRYGARKGEPQRFVNGHSLKGVTGDAHPSWRGGRYVDAQGYVRVLAHDHPRADSNGYVLGHIRVAEKALGKPLPPGGVIHHVNGEPTDNRNENLVVCQDQAYHMLLHRRQDALRASGRADWMRCRYCKEYDDPANMWCSLKQMSLAYHRECRRVYTRRQRALEKTGPCRPRE